MANNQYNGGTSALPTTRNDVPTPINTRIRDGVSYLEGQIEELHVIITSLEARLDTVLMPSPPAGGATNAQGDSGPPPSHMFARLGDLSRITADAQGRLRSLLSRIEV